MDEERIQKLGVRRQNPEFIRKATEGPARPGVATKVMFHAKAKRRRGIFKHEELEGKRRTRRIQSFDWITGFTGFAGFIRF